MPFLSTDDSHTTLHEPIPFSEVSAPYEHNFAPQAGPLPGGAPPENAQARDLEVYNDLIARGFHTAQFVWNNDGQITRIHDFSTLSGVLDVSGLTALTSLHVQNSPLTELNVSGCTALTSLHVQDTPLTELNVSGCTALASLHVQDTPLTELNVSDFTELTVLRVPNNLLTELDVSSNTALTTLEVWRNQLTELDASGLANLRELNASQNQLTSLDMSGCTALMMLNVSYNQLTALDVSSNTALTVVGGNNNQLMFSTLKLPSHTVTNSNFSGQAAVPITLKPGNTVDLASENVAGMTSYTWHYSDGTTVNSSLYTEAGGVFTFHGLSDDTVTYVSMTNAGFPGMTLQTTQVTIVGETVELTSIIPNTNSPQVGDTITTTLTPSGATATYQWFRGDTAIAGATSSSYTVITADIGYALRVVATGTGEYTGMVSHTLTNAVPPVETPPDEVDIISATGGANSLTIAWTEALTVEGDFQYRQGNSQWMTWQGTYIGNSITIVGLRAGQYEVRLVDAQGNVSYHENNINVTSSNVHIPNALKPRVRVERAATTINSITLNWTDPVRATAESNARYVVTYSIREGRSWLPVEQFTTTENRYTFTGLNPNTSYRFNVTAVNTQGEEGRNSRGTITSGVNVTAKTTNYTAVRAKATVLRGSSDASISLTPPNVNRPDRWPMGIRGNAHYATYYEVAIYNNTVSARNIPSSVPIALDMITINDETTGIIAGNATSFYISGLTLGQRYTVVIHAVTVDADGIETKSAMTRVLLNIRA
ncbi:MAG: fibronectin type III domain-containing protein [Planctomycetaceae bacterium]|nr:fibronectin type III domain-containing protein [Planctomycetaceae bacterium]